MAPIAAPPKDRVLHGILFMCLAVLCFSTLNASAKLLSAAGFDMRQVVWARYVGALLVMVVIFFFAIANLVADLLYAVLNPRIRLQ